MYGRLILLILALSTACQSGKLPCPEPKFAKIKRSTPHKGYFDPSPPLSETETTEDHHQSKASKSNSKMISHVSVEEWDCPQPGKKKYMPKEVKQNIRKNMKKINSGNEGSETDSVRTSSYKNVRH
jgi:hypothetical protein